MEKWWLCFLVIMGNFSVSLAQPTEFRQFPELKQEYQTLQALKQHLENTLDLFADTSHVQIKASEVQLLKLELRELERALNRPKGNIFEFLDQRFTYLTDSLSPPLDEATAIALFNKTYGHSSIPYAFGGYFFKNESGFCDEVTIYVTEPLINTHKTESPSRPRSFEEMTNRKLKLNIVSKLSMKNDTMLYDGRIFIRTECFEDPKDPLYIGMANKLSEPSEKRIYTYKDTTTYYELQLRDQERLLNQVQEKTETNRQVQTQLERYRDQLIRYPQQVEQIKPLIIDTLDSTLLASDADELLISINQKIDSLQSEINEYKQQIAVLETKMEELEIDALLEAQDNAESFFAKSWESHYGILDGQIEIDNIGGRPYIRLKNWSIRINF